FIAFCTSCKYGSGCDFPKVLSMRLSKTCSSPGRSLFNECCCTSLAALSGCNNNLRLMSLAVAAAPKASNATPVLLLKDCLERESPEALGEHDASFCFGIAIALASSVFNTALGALSCSSPEIDSVTTRSSPLTA